MSLLETAAAEATSTDVALDGLAAPPPPGSITRTPSMGSHSAVEFFHRYNDLLVRSCVALFVKSFCVFWRFSWREFWRMCIGGLRCECVQVLFILMCLGFCGVQESHYYTMSLIQALFLGVAGDLLAQVMESVYISTKPFKWKKIRTRNMTMLELVVGKFLTHFFSYIL